MSISYNEAIQIFENPAVFELGETFRCRIVDPTISPDEIFVRLEILFKIQGGNISPFNETGEIQSIRSGRIDLALLLDQGVLSEEQLPAVIEYLQTWDPDIMYSRGSEKTYLWLVNGTVSGDIIEFQGPNGITCAGLMNIKLTGCRIALKGLSTSQRGSDQSRAMIQKHLKTTPTTINPIDSIF